MLGWVGRGEGERERGRRGEGEEEMRIKGDYSKFFTNDPRTQSSSCKAKIAILDPKRWLHPGSAPRSFP